MSGISELNWSAILCMCPIVLLSVAMIRIRNNMTNIVSFVIDMVGGVLFSIFFAGFLIIYGAEGFILGEQYGENYAQIQKYAIMCLFFLLVSILVLVVGIVGFVRWKKKVAEDRLKYSNASSEFLAAWDDKEPKKDDKVENNDTENTENKEKPQKAEFIENKEEPPKAEFIENNDNTEDTIDTEKAKETVKIDNTEKKDNKYYDDDAFKIF